ncbi:uncharacterized protein LOC121387564 [Gigantopelta aegis]|uniref:uncharacterized protein LOC121387564 n=1 Tax=Gigantopelta aegis TaxID=1735272 RepID=UPI001B8899F9|nr:uncharacterized protein LOC121387564 [Gigantopelta aegis]
MKRKRRMSHYGDSIVLRCLTESDIARLSSSVMHNDNIEDDRSRTIPVTTGNLTSEDDVNHSCSVASFKLAPPNLNSMSTKGQDLDNDTETETETYLSDNTGISLFVKRRLSRIRRSMSMRRFTQEELAKLAAIDRSESDNCSETAAADAVKVSPPDTPFVVESSLNQPAAKDAPSAYDFTDLKESDETKHTETKDQKKSSSSQKCESSECKNDNHAIAGSDKTDSSKCHKSEESISVKD